jgi:hypothetical protein
MRHLEYDWGICKETSENVTKWPFFFGQAAKTTLDMHPTAF